MYLFIAIRCFVGLLISNSSGNLPTAQDFTYNRQGMGIARSTAACHFIAIVLNTRQYLRHKQ